MERIDLIALMAASMYTETRKATHESVPDEVIIRRTIGRAKQILAETMRQELDPQL